MTATGAAASEASSAPSGPPAASPPSVSDLDPPRRLMPAGGGEAEPARQLADYEVNSPPFPLGQSTPPSQSPRMPPEPRFPPEVTTRLGQSWYEEHHRPLTDEQIVALRSIAQAQRTVPPRRTDTLQHVSTRPNSMVPIMYYGLTLVPADAVQGADFSDACPRFLQTLANDLPGAVSFVYPTQDMRDVASGSLGRRRHPVGHPPLSFDSSQPPLRGAEAQ